MLICRRQFMMTCWVPEHIRSLDFKIAVYKDHTVYIFISSFSLRRLNARWFYLLLFSLALGIVWVSGLFKIVLLAYTI